MFLTLTCTGQNHQLVRGDRPVRNKGAEWVTPSLHLVLRSTQSLFLLPLSEERHRMKLQKPGRSPQPGRWRIPRRIPWEAPGARDVWPLHSASLPPFSPFLCCCCLPNDFQYTRLWWVHSNVTEAQPVYTTGHLEGCIYAQFIQPEESIYLPLTKKGPCKMSLLCFWLPGSQFFKSVEIS